MARKLFAVVFVLALFGLAPAPIVDHALALHAAPLIVASPSASSPFPNPAAGCSQHVCNICAQSGLVCDPIPHCHCD